MAWILSICAFAAGIAFLIAVNYWGGKDLDRLMSWMTTKILHRHRIANCPRGLIPVSRNWPKKHHA